MRKCFLRFAFGFAVGTVVMLSANLIPYWQTYEAYETDGYEVTGFPFTFRQVGGYAFTHRFSSRLLVADTAIGLVVSVCLGVVAIWLLDRSRPRGRGFEVTL